MRRFYKQITSVGWRLVSHQQIKRQTLKNIALAMVFFLIFPILSAGAVKIPDTRSISLYKIEGSADGVSITRGTKKTFKGAEGTKLAENDALTTDAKTTAYLSIDDDKIVKLDKNTKVTVSKASSAKLRITLVSGNLYFDVKKPLPASGSLEFKAGGTVMGVRGTDGVFSHVKGQVTSIIFSGNITLTVVPPPGSPLGDAPITIVINAGEFQIINSDGVPQGAPQKIDLQTMPSFVLETIIEKLTENPANAEEAAKIEQLKEIFNIKTDADITVIKEQAEQTKAVEEQQQQQQQTQIDQTTTQLDQGSQGNPPSAPSGAGGSGGSGGNNNTPQTPSVNVANFEELVVALMRSGSLNIILTESININLEHITSGSIWASEYEPDKKILGGMSQAGEVESIILDGWVNIPHDKNIIVPNGVALIVDEKVRLNFLPNLNTREVGGGKVTVNVGGILEYIMARSMEGPADKIVILGAGNTYLDKTVLLNINSGSASIGAMPEDRYDPFSQQTLPPSGTMMTQNWIQIDGNATLESYDTESIFSYIVVNSGKLTANVSMNQGDFFTSPIEVRGTFEIPALMSFNINAKSPISVANGATFINKGTVVPQDFARIKVAQGGTVTGVTGVSGQGFGTFDYIGERDAPPNPRWIKSNKVAQVRNDKYVAALGSVDLEFDPPLDTSNIKEYKVSFDGGSEWSTMNYFKRSMLHLATGYNTTLENSITVSSYTITSVAIANSGWEDNSVTISDSPFSITVAGEPLSFTAGINGTVVEITGAGIVPEADVSYVVQFTKTGGMGEDGKSMTFTVYNGSPLLTENGITDDTYMYDDWTLSGADTVKVWKVTNMSTSGFTITPFGGGQLIMLR